MQLWSARWVLRLRVGTTCGSSQRLIRSMATMLIPAYSRQLTADLTHIKEQLNALHEAAQAITETAVALAEGVEGDIEDDEVRARKSERRGWSRVTDLVSSLALCSVSCRCTFPPLLPALCAPSPLTATPALPLTRHHAQIDARPAHHPHDPAGHAADHARREQDECGRAGRRWAVGGDGAAEAGGV